MSDTLRRRRRLARILQLPLRLIPPAARLPILTGPSRGTCWITGSSLHGSWLGTFERDKQALFAAALRAGDVVYDLGAHVGLYTLLAASRIGAGGRVYAFEPLPRNLRYLEQHLAINHADNCTVLDAAVSSSSGTAEFDEGAHPATGHLGATGARAITVRTAVLDDLLASQAIRPPSVIKCDIEGAEYEALSGATALLAAHRPIVFLATHGGKMHDLCCGLLEASGYDLYSLDERPLPTTTELLALPK